MNKIFTLLATIVLFLLVQASLAQTSTIGPNEYAFQYSANPNFGLFFNATDGRYEFRNGSANSSFGIDASSGALTNDLSFENGNDLLIGDNSYAFRSATSSNYGLYFNSVDLRYEFLNGSASPIFAVNANNGRFDSNIQFNSGKNLLVAPGEFALRSAAVPNAGLVFGFTDYEFRSASGVPIFTVDVNTGDVEVDGSLKIGSSSTGEAGSIRYNGGDFEGFNGTAWSSLTEGTVGPQGEQGPQGVQGLQGPAGLLPASSAVNSIPYYEGADWTTEGGAMRMNSDAVSIGTAVLDYELALLNVRKDEVGNNPGFGVINAFRQGGASDNEGTGSSWRDIHVDAAIRGISNWGNSYTAGVYGTSYLDYENSAAVVGARTTTNPEFGALAYKDGNGDIYAGYFNGKMAIKGDALVDGNIRAKSVTVTLDVFPDYVFALGYSLMPLSEVKDFIDKNGHLPNMPSESEVIENGLNLNEINVVLVEKVEELTLHLIEKEQQFTELKEANSDLEKRLRKLEEALLNE